MKPARGEQGRGISVGLETIEDVEAAIAKAREVSDDVLIEQCVAGEDLRLIVINFRVVAAAMRRPPKVVGDGQQTIGKLIAAQSRRRSAATGGESTIPLDAETTRTIAAAGYSLDDVLPANEELTVRAHRQPAHRRHHSRCHRDRASGAGGGGHFGGARHRHSRDGHRLHGKVATHVRICIH